MPSWPLMPTPMCAAWIMPTSFAPSPMASVIFPESFTRPVTSAFCKGLTRQHTTETHPVPKDKKSGASVGSSANARLRPSITTPMSRSRAEHSSHAAMPFLICAATEARPLLSKSSLEIARSLSSLIKSLMLITCTSMSSRNNEHACPMLIAVSCLSPVKTQTATPARMSCSMHPGTPSCSLSSMAVAPSNSSSVSITSAHASIFSSRFSRLCAAAVYVSFQDAYSALESSRFARHSVRKPLAA
mmetsp:Transcript_14832/g.62611  ORF Transcript_14832/g.62611 Transcript_14832/m.62611 type:complete len:244 (-) Transcript_14832:2140-2871(-)